MDGLFIGLLAHRDVLTHCARVITLCADAVGWIGAVSPEVTQVMIDRHVITVCLRGGIQTVIKGQGRCGRVQCGTAVPGFSPERVNNGERS